MKKPTTSKARHRGMSSPPWLFGHRKNDFPSLNKKKLSIILLFFIVLSFSGYGQIASFYTMSQSSITYADLVSPTGSTISGDSDDGEEVNVPIGFTFTYLGNSYTTLTVGVNGGVILTNFDLGFTNDFTSTDFDKTNVIAPLWDDLYHRTADNAQISYQTSGVSPNQTFTVQWKNLSWRSSGNTVNFQLVLYEGSNNIEFKYGASNSSENRSASIGFNNGSTGTDFISVTPGTPATTSYSISNNAISSADYPGNGVSYLFTYAIPSCYPPSNLGANNMTLVGADLTWSAATTAPASYDWFIVAKGDPATGTVLESGSTTGTSATSTMLNHSTFYDYYVKSNCGTSQSVLMGPYTFATLCGPYNIPIYEDFDGVAGGSSTNPTTPHCWSYVESSGNPGYGYTQTTTGNLGPGRFYMWSSSNTTGNQLLVSPEITSLTSGTNRVRFSAYTSSSTGGPVEVGTMTDPTDATTFVSFASIPLTTLWTEYTALIPAGTSTRLAFRNANTLTSKNLYLDDINIEPIPTCDVPTSLTSGTITNSDGTFSWTAPTLGTPVGYNYIVVASGAGPTGTAVASGSVTGPTATFTGLTGTTTYDFYVQTDCGGGDVSVWAGPSTFTTDCDPVSVLPYSEDFSSWLTACWLEGNAGDAVSGPGTIGYGDWLADGFLNNGTTGAARINIYSTADRDWLISPFISIPTTSSYSLSYDVGATDNSTTSLTNAWESDDSLLVMISTDGTNWVELMSYNDQNVPSASGQYEVIDLSAYAGMDVKIAFVSVEGALNGPSSINAYIDNFLVDVSPTCFPVSNISTSNVTDMTADLSWNAPTAGAPANYVWVVVNAGDPASMTTNVASGSVAHVTGTTAQSTTMTGMAQNTSYDAYILTDCGSNDSSIFAGPVSFTTECTPGTVGLTTTVEGFENAGNGSSTNPSPPSCWKYIETPGSTGYGYTYNTFNAPAGSYAFYLYSSGSSSTDDLMLVTPAYTDLSDATNWVKFKATSTSSANPQLQVGTLSDPNDPTTFTLLSTISLTNGPVEYTVPLPSGTDKNVAFRHGQVSTYQNIYLDEVVIEDAPSCLPPTAITTSNLTSSSTDISWTAPVIGTPSSYNYIVVPVGTGTSGVPVGQGSGSATTGMVSGLAGNTSYDIYVQTDCGGTTSTWEGPVTFTTYCAITAPYTYDVESASTTTNSSIADCWSSSPTGTSSSYRWDIDGAGSTPSSGTGPASANSGVKYFYTEATSGNPGDTAILQSTIIDASSLTIPYLQYSYHMYGADMGNLYVEVWDGTAFVTVDSLIGQQHASTSLPWNTAGIDISAVAASTTQIRFVGVRGSGYTSDMSIDDIALIEAPTCINPSAPMATFNAATGNVDLSWTAPQGAPPVDYNYLVVVADSGYASANIVAGGTVTSSPASITGLSSGVSYDMFVQSNCGAGVSNWTGPVTYSLPCFETLPYTQDFEGTGCLPTCWGKENLNGDIYSFCMAGQVPCNGLKSVRLDPNTSSTAPANNDWVYSPLFNLTAGTSYRIKFTYTNDDPAKRQKLSMYVGSDQTNASQTTILFKDDSISSATCQNVEIDYTPTTSGFATFGFHADADPGQGFIGVDDFSIDLTPAMSAWSVVDNSNNNACVDSAIFGAAGDAWHELHDVNGNIVLSINPNGNELGTVAVKYIDQSAPEQWTAVGSGGSQFKTVPRRFAITPQYQPTTPVSVRFFFKGQELDDFNASTLGSGTVTNYAVSALLFTKHETTSPDCILTNNTGGASLLSFIDGPVGTAPTSGSQDFYVEASVPIFSEFTLHEPTAVGPLNISFENFEGHLADSRIQLSWNLLDANLGNQIEVEKLHNGIWRTIGQVDVNTSETYTFEDVEVAAINTYRLSYLGKKSDVLSVKDASGTIVSIYPNPADNYIKVEVDNASAEDLTLSIYDVVGRKMITKNIKTTRNSAQEEILIGDLPAGSYLIKIEDQNSVLYNSALIVK